MASLFHAVSHRHKEIAHFNQQLIMNKIKLLEFTKNGMASNWLIKMFIDAGTTDLALVRSYI